MARLVQNIIALLPYLVSKPVETNAHKNMNTPKHAVTTYGVKILLWNFSAILFEYYKIHIIPVNCWKTAVPTPIQEER